MKVINFRDKEYIRATVCVVENEDKVLMIKHKRGFFEGTYNCPGGKQELDENIYETSVRETFEETGITPNELVYVGTVLFDNSGVKNFAVDFHKCEGEFEGEVIGENEECTSMWVKKEDIPYNEMQKGDDLLLEMILEGKSFTMYKKDGEFNKLDCEQKFNTLYL